LIVDDKDAYPLRTDDELRAGSDLIASVLF
jgi:hypothetical protein